jgi:hypothetical protein
MRRGTLLLVDHVYEEKAYIIGINPNVSYLRKSCDQDRPSYHAAPTFVRALLLLVYENDHLI